ncbi:flagellar hook-associated protein FlgK [Citricoccus sp. I39-566]|uniref:flagellar hook-associated protein FlgK n=1 Tax=Citricoccus sp. I39-566 TaxID=3073268 RepID=UPI00286D5870|nr:flagellar hook-associated protein FlgK [Citricoccus sp. I39-566]WMY77992.1 flagellar hook-associated protein FlgK [Citricoccus sp. I39-566]
MGLSTFHSLNTAARGLEAARAQIAITAQNTANAGTVGYTRQSAQLQSLPGVQPTGLFTNPTGVGQGVEVAGIGRSASELVNRQVRGAVAQTGFQQVRAEAYSGIEDVLREPGDGSVSSAVNAYHSAWQDLANNPGDAGAGAALLEAAGSLAGRLRADVQQLKDQYAAQGHELRAEVAQVNSLAEQLAQINGAIRSTGAAGGSTNELLDHRDQLAEQLSSLTGGQLRPAADGTGDFLVGGNALVSGENTKPLAVGEAADGTTIVQWEHRSGSAGVDGGSLAGRLSVLSTEGPLAGAIQGYDDLAASMANGTNGLHQGGTTGDGVQGGAFFDFDPANPAESLRVVISNPADIAHAGPNQGALDGSVADAISSLGESVSSSWTGFVSGVGSASRSALNGLSLSVGTESSARASQQSLASVDRDEEAVNLVTFQHAYQASARVLTAVDEMLDTLINRVGLVGR